MRDASPYDHVKVALILNQLCKFKILTICSMSSYAQYSVFLTGCVISNHLNMVRKVATKSVYQLIAYNSVCGAARGFFRVSQKQYDFQSIGPEGSRNVRLSVCPSVRPSVEGGNHAS